LIIKNEFYSTLSELSSPSLSEDEDKFIVTFLHEACLALATLEIVEAVLAFVRKSVILLVVCFFLKVHQLLLRTTHSLSENLHFTIAKYF